MYRVLTDIWISSQQINDTSLSIGMEEPKDIEKLKISQEPRDLQEYKEPCRETLGIP